MNNNCSQNKEAWEVLPGFFVLDKVVCALDDRRLDFNRGLHHKRDGFFLAVVSANRLNNCDIAVQYVHVLSDANLSMTFGRS